MRSIPSSVALLPLCPHDFALWSYVDTNRSLRVKGSRTIAVAVGTCRACGPMTVKRPVSEGAVPSGAVEERGQDRVQDLRNVDSGIVSHTEHDAEGGRNG